MKHLLFGGSPLAMGIGGMLLVTYQYTHFSVSVGDTLTMLAGLATIAISAAFYVGKRLRAIDTRMTHLETRIEPCKCGAVEDRMDEILGRFEARMQTALTTTEDRFFAHLSDRDHD